MCAAAVLDECLGLKRSERVVVMSDRGGYEVGRAFWEAATEMCKEAFMALISPGRVTTPPEELLKFWLERADVAIVNTQNSIQLSSLQEIASVMPVRIARMRFTNNEKFIRIMDVDWKRHGLFTRKCAALLGAASLIKVESPEGTDLEFRNSGRTLMGQYGKIASNGSAERLPAGDAKIIPLEGSVNGRLVLDSSCGNVSDAPLELAELSFKEDLVVRVRGRFSAKEHEKLFGRRGGQSGTVISFSAGTLASAGVDGCLHEARLARGTVNFEYSFYLPGGERQGFCAVIRRPSVWLDGRLWIDRGNYV